MAKKQKLTEEQIATKLYALFREAEQNQEKTFKIYNTLMAEVNKLSEDEIKNQLYERFLVNQQPDKFELTPSPVQKFIDFIGEVQVRLD